MKYFLVEVEGKRKLIDYAKDIPKGVEAEEIDIPTDKDGLRNAIQELLTEADTANAKALEGLGTAVSVMHQQLDESRPLKLTGNDSDGFPRVRSAYTHAQVGAQFTKMSEHLRDICHAISKLSGADLGHVAFQVAAQITKPITIQTTEGGSDG